MARPPKDPNKVTVEKSQLDDIMARLDASDKRNSDLEAKIARGNKQGIETSAQRLLSRPQMGEPDMAKAQKSIQVLNKPATIDGTMIEDACPYCKKFNSGLPTVLDLTNANKFACRRCGKHWEQWAIKPSQLTEELYPYSEALERGDKKRVEYQERIQMAKNGMAVGLVEGEEEVA